MADYNETGILTLEAASDIEAFRGLKRDSNGKWAYAGAGEAHMGLAESTMASGRRVDAKLRNFPGSRKVVAAGAFAAGAFLFAAASGKVDDVAVGAAQYKAKTAATADGDVVEAYPIQPGCDDVVSASYTITAGDVTATYVDVDTGFGVRPRGVSVVVTNAAGTTQRAITTTFPSAGTVRITPTGITAGDIMTYRFQV